MILNLINILITIFFCGGELISCGSISSRMMNGSPIQTLQRFPHYVEIETTLRNSQGIKKCSGSIIKDQWILTTANCVRDGLKHRIYFQKLQITDDSDSYSIDVSNTRVYEYPTGYDDLALIRLPVKLQFNKFVNAISIMESDDDYGNQLGVLPGFNKNRPTLDYGMFRIINIENCQKKYNDEVDEFLHLCTEAWINRGNQRQYPCEGDQGSGLVVGWPKSPKLLGIFSFPLSCERDSGEPAVHIRLSKYVPWIYTTIENAEGAVTPIPTTTPTTTSTTPFTTTTTAATTMTTDLTTFTTDADTTTGNTIITTSYTEPPFTGSTGFDSSTSFPSTVPDTSTFTNGGTETSHFQTVTPFEGDEYTTAGATPGSFSPCFGNECY